MSGVRACARALSGAIVHYFGNHSRALRAAGIDPDTVAKAQRWTRADVLARLRERRVQGLELSFTAISRDDSRLWSQIQRRFGGMNQVMAKLGLANESVGRYRRWSRPQIVARLRSLHQAGTAMRFVDVRATNTALAVAAFRHFGSWKKALAAARLSKPPDRPRGARPMIWTPERIKAFLIARYAQGLPLTAGDVKRADPLLYNGCAKRFGSFAKALEYAGLGRAPIFGRDKPWTRQGVLETVQQHFAPGQEVSLAMLREHRLLSWLKGARAFFGTISEALAAAGLEYAPLPGFQRRRWTRVHILSTLRELRAQGADLRPSRLVQEHQGLYRAAARIFKSFAKALAAAGIHGLRIERGRPQWTRALILRLLKREYRAGRDVRTSEFRRTHGGVSTAIRRCFGGHRQALKAAKIPWPPKKPLANMPWPQVIAQIRALAKKRADLRYDAVKKAHQALFHAGRYYFGRWAEAIASAGLDYQQLVHAATAHSPGLASCSEPVALIVEG